MLSYYQLLSILYYADIGTERKMIRNQIWINPKIIDRDSVVHENMVAGDGAVVF